MTYDKKKNGELESLNQKLSEIQARKLDNSSEGKLISSANIGWRMILELVIGMVVGIILGFGLDYLFDTRPIFLIVMALFGFGGGIRAMMRTAKELDK
jgi:ATP synthase protein I